MTTIRGDDDATPLAPAAPPSPSLARAGLAVAPAMLLANLLQYALQLTASRSLTPGPFGALGALLGLGVIGAVPMLALQAVSARHVALVRADPDRHGPEVARLVRLGLRASAAVAVIGVLLAPAVAAFLHVSVLDSILLGLGVAPLALVGSSQGVLQGEERFGALAAAFVTVAALRVGGAVVPLLLDGGVRGALAGTLVGSVVAALLLARGLGSRALGVPGPVPPGFLAEVRGAGGGLLGLLVLGAVDLLLARHVLARRDSGVYAAGALVARACFWAPQFVAVLVLPRMAAGQRHVARRATAVVGGLGLLATVVAALVPAAVVTLVFGPGYRSLTGELGLFALAGSLLALVQLLLYSGIATGGSRVSWLVWAAAAVEVVVLLVLRPGLLGIVVTACVCIGLLAAAALTVTVRRR